MGFEKYDETDPAHRAWRARIEANMKTPRGVGAALREAKGAEAKIRVAVDPSDRRDTALSTEAEDADWNDIDAELARMGLTDFVEGVAPIDIQRKD